MQTKKYRKIPVVVEAYQTDEDVYIETLEGTMHASIGDYIITGVNGEQYPCKPDIFAKTYEEVGSQTGSLSKLDKIGQVLSRWDEGKYRAYVALETIREVIDGD